VLHGVPVSDCLGGTNPGRRDCVTSQSSAADIARGIAVFGVSDAGQNGGFGAAFGKTSGGYWKLWFTSQNPYQLLRLPGEMRVCGEREGVNIRSGPSADGDLVGSLPDLSMVTGEQFVLTESVDSGSAGFGWFRISSPLGGWVYSKYLEAAELDANCTIRNAQVNGR
jgi:hypothetical protein